ncbi:ATP-dependent zinc metalloprotease FtsH [Anaeromicrobium sediminis]|uniref:ATP-dependent zinc metalloprotease FtsH n=1 Tax=Anaeromicrobium sediminis TaxID=1478221 RepID=A0A267MFQ5_9FIRM|nr:ATP-dependent zinc metalloprotease FtsH [Anaeromicrobium sediminis]PAB57623.1 cell division protein FtsH [Anaeromicrobium sediminis]
MKKFFRGASFYILIFVVIILIVQFYGQPTQERLEIGISDFIVELQKGNISEIDIVENKVTGTLKGNKPFETYIPSVIKSEALVQEYIFPQIKAGKLKVTAQPPAKTPWFFEILPTIFMILIFGAFWFIFMQQSQGGGSRVMSFGKSRAKLHKEDEHKKVTFDDVAGLEEEKEELQEVVDFLKNPRKYIELGARIPKGILMVGPPGTGKTYLSRATAGEAGVPFFSISGSDFVEMFVGVGASRVRDLFEQAKKESPCIVFIDEIDAVGRKRGAGLGGGHDEREQTLNQLLVEMDGFGVNEGIIIIAATNRPDILDPALLRPGRFDRQVMVGVPDVKGREAILKVHARNKPLADDVDLKVLAKRTPGFTPADIENLMNEAALLSARANKKTIEMPIVEEAITKVIAGPEKKSKVITEKDKKLTAFHEAGHAVVSKMLPNSDPVHQVTIIPRGRAGGFTMYLPKEEKSYTTKSEMEERIVSLLGGRMAEKLVLDDISTGASNDIERATSIARAMVTKYGMSDALGPISYSSDEEVFLGRDFSSKSNYSEEVASKIDAEIRNIIDKGYERAEQILTDNMDKLYLIAETLLEVETLNAEEFDKLFDDNKISLQKVDREVVADEMKLDVEEIKIDDEIKIDEMKMIDEDKNSEEQ